MPTYIYRHICNNARGCTLKGARVHIRPEVKDGYYLTPQEPICMESHQALALIEVTHD